MPQIRDRFVGFLFYLIISFLAGYLCEYFHFGFDAFSFVRLLFVDQLAFAPFALVRCAFHFLMLVVFVFPFPCVVSMYLSSVSFFYSFLFLLGIFVITFTLVSMLSLLFVYFLSISLHLLHSLLFGAPFTF